MCEKTNRSTRTAIVQRTVEIVNQGCCALADGRTIEMAPLIESCLYSDAMIVSPDCPIFGDDEGNRLDRPVKATFITSAAPSAGAIATNPQGTALASKDVPATFRA